MAVTTPSAEVVGFEGAKVTIASLVIAVVLGSLFSVSAISGVAYFLVHSGRLRVPTSVATEVKQAPQQSATHALVLEPLLVNLADAGGNAYLRVGITLRVVDANDRAATAGKKQGKDGVGSASEAQDLVAALRDTVLAVLGRQMSTELLAADGKEHLKSELRKAIAERNGEIKVTDLYFTEFLVQR